MWGGVFAFRWHCAGDDVHLCFCLFSLWLAHPGPHCPFAGFLCHFALEELFPWSMPTLALDTFGWNVADGGGIKPWATRSI